MADIELRRKLKAYQSGSLSLNEMAAIIYRLGLYPIYNYTSCKRCGPETRCHRSHGQMVLCSECGGDGWTDARITGWQTPN